MGFASEAVKAVGHALKNVHAGADKLASRKVASELTPDLRVESSAFSANAPLPMSATVRGLGQPPPINWSKPPDETRSIVVLCEDPDAPFPEPYVHWLVYGIHPRVTSVDGQSAAMWSVGKSSKLAPKFAPAAPPPGHGQHHYHFQVFALDRETELEPGLGRGAILDHMKGHVIAWGEIVGTYERP